MVAAEMLGREVESSAASASEMANPKHMQIADNFRSIGGSSFKEIGDKAVIMIKSNLFPFFALPQTPGREGKRSDAGLFHNKSVGTELPNHEADAVPSFY